MINLGEIGLAPGPKRWLVQADLDDYLSAVAAELGLDEARIDREAGRAAHEAKDVLSLARFEEAS